MTQMGYPDWSHRDGGGREVGSQGGAGSSGNHEPHQQQQQQHLHPQHQQQQQKYHQHHQKRSRRIRQASQTENAAARASSSAVVDSDSDAESDHGIASPDPRYTSERSSSIQKDPANRPPPKKRPHLDHQDVGRFASMNLVESDDEEEDEVLAGPSARLGNRTKRRQPSMLLQRLPHLNEPKQSARAPPSTPTGSDVANDDAVMGKPASSWEIDAYRTYVASLDDSDSEDDGKEASSEDTQPFGLGDMNINASGSASTPSPLSASSTSTSPTSLEINPELLTKLEAHSRSLLVGSGPRTSVRSSGVVPTPPSMEEAAGRLILWKSPSDLLGSTEHDEEVGEVPDGLEAKGHGSQGSVAAVLAPRAPPSSPEQSCRRSVLSETISADTTPTTSVSPAPIFSFGHASPPQTFSPRFGPARSVSGGTASRSTSGTASPASLVAMRNISTEGGREDDGEEAGMDVDLDV